MATPAGGRRAAGKYAGCEVYRSQGLELRAGDRVRVTRKYKRTGLVNGQMARAASIEEDRVRFELEDGGTIAMREGDPQLRFLDHAWAPTIHAFQGRTVDTVIVALESHNPSLVNQKPLYVAFSRAPDKAIEQYWSGAGEQVLDGGAEIEKKPARQIAELGAELEGVEQAVPGTGRGVAPDPERAKSVGDSPGREADMDKEREPIERDMDM